MSFGVCHRRGSDLVLPLLWLVAPALIQPLAWELPCVTCAALETKQNKKPLSKLRKRGAMELFILPMGSKAGNKGVPSAPPPPQLCRGGASAESRTERFCLVPQTRLPSTWFCPPPQLRNWWKSPWIKKYIVLKWLNFFWILEIEGKLRQTNLNTAKGFCWSELATWRFLWMHVLRCLMLGTPPKWHIKVKPHFVLIECVLMCAQTS